MVPRGGHSREARALQAAAVSLDGFAPAAGTQAGRSMNGKSTETRVNFAKRASKSGGG